MGGGRGQLAHRRAGLCPHRRAGRACPRGRTCAAPGRLGRALGTGPDGFCLHDLRGELDSHPLAAHRLLGVRVYLDAGGLYLRAGAGQLGAGRLDRPPDAALGHSRPLGVGRRPNGPVGRSALWPAAPRGRRAGQPLCRLLRAAAFERISPRLRPDVPADFCGRRHLPGRGQALHPAPRHRGQVGRRCVRGQHARGRARGLCRGLPLDSPYWSAGEHSRGHHSQPRVGPLLPLARWLVSPPAGPRTGTGSAAVAPSGFAPSGLGRGLAQQRPVPLRRAVRARGPPRWARHGIHHWARPPLALCRGRHDRDGDRVGLARRAVHAGQRQGRCLVAGQGFALAFAVGAFAAALARGSPARAADRLGLRHQLGRGLVPPDRGHRLRRAVARSRGGDRTL